MIFHSNINNEDVFLSLLGEFFSFNDLTEIHRNSPARCSPDNNARKDQNVLMMLNPRYIKSKKGIPTDSPSSAPPAAAAWGGFFGTQTWLVSIFELRNAGQVIDALYSLWLLRCLFPFPSLNETMEEDSWSSEDDEASRGSPRKLSPTEKVRGKRAALSPLL